MKYSVLLVFVIYSVNTGFTCPTPDKKTTLPPGGIEWQNCTRPNEYYNCGSACQTECATLGQVCPKVNIRCNDDCYCVEGYARDARGVCIPIRDCFQRHPTSY